MNIKTTDLQKVANLAINGCGQNSQIPITQLFGIRTLKTKDGNFLVVGSTDTINYLYAKTKIESDEAIDICINANVFTQLVNKFTTDTISLTLKEKYLLVEADGEYKLELALLENGELLKFPRNANLEISGFPEPKVVKTEKFRKLVAYGKDALATMENEVDLNGYFVNDDMLIATNRKIMVALKDTLGLNAVLRRKFVDLICESKDDEVYFYELDDKNFLLTDTIMNIYSSINSPVENYPSKQISNVINNSEFEVHFKVDAKKLMNILDRVSLVVTKYEADIIELTVSGGILFVSSMKSTGAETLELLPGSEGEIINPEYVWSGKINCEWLATQLGTFDKEIIDLYIGNKICIKLVQDDVSKLISLA